MHVGTLLYWWQTVTAHYLAGLTKTATAAVMCRTTLPLKDLPAGRTRDMWLGFVEDEQDAMPGGGPKTAGHNAGVYQGTADGHDKEHRSLVDKAMKAINPGPNQANQHLKECKLHVQVSCGVMVVVNFVNDAHTQWVVALAYK